jgi:peptidoglycan/xylan/chitin deacetylase (PgdA/CDA1 family)
VFIEASLNVLLIKTMLHRALELFLGSAIRPFRVEDGFSALETLGPPAVLVFSPHCRLKDELSDLGYTYFRSFLALPSRTAVRWLLPMGNTAVSTAGSQIYQPHKLMPRAVKKIFMGMIKTGFNDTWRSRVLVASKDRLPLETLVHAHTGEAQPVFALSFGREAAIRKLTVQVMRPDGEILGYMKLPFTEAATARVRNEAKALESLWTFPALRPHIPHLLHAGTWGGGYILFQSSLQGEPGPPSLSTAHHEFLETLWTVKRVDRTGFSLVDEVSAKWSKAVVSLDSKWKELGREALRRATRDLDGRIIRCGISHGDFAPWNTRVNQGKLLLFDWESSHPEAPTSWDIFHFGLQTAVSLNKRADNSFPGECSESNESALYLLYLLSSTTQFVQEGNRTAIDHRRRLLLAELEKTTFIQREDRPAPKQPARYTRRAAEWSAKTPILGSSTRPRIVTTSWDDGDSRDISIAEELRSRGMTGTFYIPMSCYMNKIDLTPANLRDLSSEGFEIGAHSVSHNFLTLLTEGELEPEVRISKQTLEQIIGKEVTMFCYPNGRYNRQVIQQVKRAGYKGARTTRMLSIRSAFLPFEMPTSLQAFPHPAGGYLRDLGRARNIDGLWRFTTELSWIDNWVDLGKKLFSQVLEHGGIWHLYGHSWEIGDLRLWDDLREMLDFVSNREGVTYLTNGQLLPALTNKEAITRTEVHAR